MSGFLSALVSRIAKGNTKRMPKKSTGPVSPLRAARLAEGRGWSLRFVARKIHSNPTTLSEWERGISTPPPDARAAFCKLYQARPEELGFTTNTPNSDAPESLSRRAFLTAAITIPLAIGVQSLTPPVSGSTIETLASVNMQYRAWQNEGIVYSRELLQGHISTIEHLLATTLDYGSRRELYHLLSQAQFLACGGRTNPERLTLLEKAVASAQQSGDTLLLAGMLSHLGQFYTFRLQHPDFADHYLTMSAQLGRGDPPLIGWIAAQQAEAAALQQNAGDVTRHMAIAEKHTPYGEPDDRFYTTWNQASLAAYRGACYLHLGAFDDAAKHFERTQMDNLTVARRVVPLVDMAYTYTMLGDISNASHFIAAATDAAQATGHYGLIPKIKSISETLQKKYPADARTRQAAEKVRTVPQMIAV